MAVGEVYQVNPVMIDSIALKGELLTVLIFYFLSLPRHYEQPMDLIPNFRGIAEDILSSFKPLSIFISLL